MILVFGKTGQVARELARRRGAREVICLDRAEADLTDPAQCVAAIKRHRPRAVINAAAYTAVDRAETEAALAETVNATTPRAMAQTCAALDLPLLHISTDYVFDGSGDQLHRPGDQTAPQNVYGRSKLAGERGIRAAGGAHLILRTSWVFSAHGANFVKTMLRLAETRESLSVVNDQYGGPTPAAGIAEALLRLSDAMLAGHRGGTYHYAGTPDATWADFAREIFAQTGRAVEVTGTATADYPTPATRPLNSRLDCSSLKTDFGISRPEWRAALADVLKELS
ncbi:dTDP-4-dehydrorhamnose reductase [Sulfitobacter sp. PS-8MA]|uniref:dTDP-4-dehydrorhamnose reductase n=1 Tax=Sulfitobacter sp. PS-8MA TaxID=3237707 RepID=UPI0034C5D5EF